jgi:hypothetical protein
MKTGIAVCFPGTGFTCKEALFERLASDYSARGYDVMKLDFSHIRFGKLNRWKKRSRSHSAQSSGSLAA